MTTVIKPGAGANLLPAASPLHLSEHIAEAANLVERARKEAARIIDDAKRLARRYFEESKTQGYQAAYQEGFDQGTIAGRKEALEQSLQQFASDHESLVSSLEKLLREIEARKTDIQIAAHRDLLEFATKLAEKMTFEIGRTRHESAQENLRAAVRFVGEATDLTIRVHPVDLETMRVFAPAMFKRLRDATHAGVVADETIAPGGCVVSTDRTQVDATLETQTSLMRDAILGAEPSNG